MDAPCVSVSGSSAPYYIRCALFLPRPLPSLGLGVVTLVGLRRSVGFGELAGSNVARIRLLGQRPYRVGIGLLVLLPGGHSGRATSVGEV